jgi:hypothetical protein
MVAMITIFDLYTTIVYRMHIHICMSMTDLKTLFNKVNNWRNRLFSFELDFDIDVNNFDVNDFDITVDSEWGIFLYEKECVIVFSGMLC